MPMRTLLLPVPLDGSRILTRSCVATFSESILRMPPIVCVIDPVRSSWSPTSMSVGLNTAMLDRANVIFSMPATRAKLVATSVSRLTSTSLLAWSMRTRKFRVLTPFVPGPLKFSWK